MQVFRGLRVFHAQLLHIAQQLLTILLKFISGGLFDVFVAGELR